MLLVRKKIHIYYIIQFVMSPLAYSALGGKSRKAHKKAHKSHRRKSHRKTQRKTQRKGSR